MRHFGNRISEAIAIVRGRKKAAGDTDVLTLDAYIVSPWD